MRLNTHLHVYTPVKAGVGLYMWTDGHASMHSIPSSLVYYASSDSDPSTALHVLLTLLSPITHPSEQQGSP